MHPFADLTYRGLNTLLHADDPADRGTAEQALWWVRGYLDCLLRVQGDSALEIRLDSELGNFLDGAGQISPDLPLHSLIIAHLGAEVRSAKGPRSGEFLRWLTLGRGIDNSWLTVRFYVTWPTLSTRLYIALAIVWIALVGALTQLPTPQISLPVLGVAFAPIVAAGLLYALAVWVWKGTQLRDLDGHITRVASRLRRP